MSVAAVAGIALTGTAIGMTAAGVGQPNQPNLASSSAQLSNAEASLLPAYRQLQAAAELGTSTPANGYSGQDAATVRSNIQSQINQLEAPYQSGGQQGFGPNNHGGQGTPMPASVQSQVNALQAQLQKIPSSGKVYFDSQGNIVPQSQAVVDFSGNGAADIQGKLAEQMAGGELGLEQKYDPQFIQAALEQEALANPQGVQARQMENNLIQQQINQPLQNPVAQTLQDQVQKQVAAGKGLDEFDQNALNQAVGDALKARGGAGAPADFASDLTTGQAGTQRELAAIQKGQNLLTSGITPQDVAYRRNQQNLANLSSEYSGQTPLTEFRSLAGAQNGATPITSGQALPLMNDSLGTASSAAQTQYAQQQGQANPWLSGITSAINAGTAIGNAFGGYQPLAPNQG